MCSTFLQFKAPPDTLGTIQRTRALSENQRSEKMLYGFQNDPSLWASGHANPRYHVRMRKKIEET